jgi:Phd_YefM.
MYIITYRKKIKTTSVSDFRTNMNGIWTPSSLYSDCVVINRGNTGAVLISLEEYNSIKGTEAILASERMASAIRTGLEDIARSEVEEIDIDAL